MFLIALNFQVLGFCVFNFRNMLLSTSIFTLISYQDRLSVYRDRLAYRFVIRHKQIKILILINNARISVKIAGHNLTG